MRRILIVDDEKSIVFAIRQYFTQRNFVVDCAGSAEDALDCLAREKYALAIVDIHLRGQLDGGDGLLLAAFIRSHAPSTAIIVLSAAGSAENARRAAEMGVHSFLQKPTPLAHVADIASDLIG